MAPVEKRPADLPNTSVDSRTNEMRPPILVGRNPPVNPDSRLDRNYDNTPASRNEVRVLPAEIKQELRRIAAIDIDEMSAVYEYLERLVQDGEEFETAVKKTYENVWPAD